MKIDRISLLIDAYQDGQIEKNDAVELAQVIRSGGPQSQWVMKELEFRGLITHVFDESSPNRFVQSLMERFRANDDADHFKDEFQKRIQGAPRSTPNSENAGFKRVLNTTGNATEADALKSNPTASKKPLFIFAALMVIVGILSFSMGWFQSEVGTLKQAAMGLRLQRDNQDLKVQQGMVLYSGDRLSSLATGKSQLHLGQKSQLNLFDESTLVLNLNSPHLDSENFSGFDSAYLERGKVKVLIQKDDPFIVWTPHALVKCTSGNIEIVCTDLNTLIKVKSANILLSPTSNTQEQSFEGEATFLVNDAGQIDKLPETRPLLNGEQ